MTGRGAVLQGRLLQEIIAVPGLPLLGVRVTALPGLPLGCTAQAVAILLPGAPALPMAVPLTLPAVLVVVPPMCDILDYSHTYNHFCVFAKILSGGNRYQNTLHGSS
jgi:hypothetical protein